MVTGTVALCWELGGGYGHVHSLAVLADALQRRGATVVLIVKELHRAEAAFGGRGVPIMQAPLSARPRVAPARLHTLGETLGMAGYDCVEHFGPIYRAWRMLLESIGADLVVGDYAPTALLAARGLGIPRVEIGTGWTTPPLSTPTPFLSPWTEPPSAEVRLGREARVVAVVNGVLMRCGDPPIGSLSELHDTDDRFLLTFEELDHFGPRKGARYLGTLASGHANAPPVWPAGDAPRIFGYVSARHWGFERLMNQLAALSLPTVVHARDLDPSRAATLQTETLHVARDIVDVDVAFSEASVVVSHGGHGTTSRALLAGRPLLVLPEHDEQALMGHRLSAQGLGVSVGHRRGVEHDYGSLLDTLLHSPSHAAAATAFAERYAGFAQADAVTAMADGCVALLA